MTRWRREVFQCCMIWKLSNVTWDIIHERGLIHMKLKFQNVSQFFVASKLLRFPVHLNFPIFYSHYYLKVDFFMQYFPVTSTLYCWRATNKLINLTLQRVKQNWDSVGYLQDIYYTAIRKIIMAVLNEMFVDYICRWTEHLSSSSSSSSLLMNDTRILSGLR